MKRLPDGTTVIRHGRLLDYLVPPAKPVPQYTAFDHGKGPLDATEWHALMLKKLEEQRQWWGAHVIEPIFAGFIEVFMEMKGDPWWPPTDQPKLQIGPTDV